MNKRWITLQIDINNAVFQGTLKDEVYVTQPQGFIDHDRPQYDCRLRKVLYTLKKAPRTWYQELRQYLLT